MTEPNPSIYPKSLLIGVEHIDREHQAIFRRVSDIVEAVAAGKIGTVREDYRALINAFAEHFQHEEQAMAKSGYENTAKHKQHHAEFIVRLERWAVKAAGSSEAALEAGYDALDTLFRDALNGDTEYATWLSSQ
jgi:hemerythrin-like metal-binding protein